MKRLALLLLLASSTYGATTTAIRLELNETRTVQILGTTAAWAIDADVVDASAADGGVLLFARAAGRTKVMVISMTGENALDVIVESRSKSGIAAQAEQQKNDHATAEVRYSSATREVQNNVTITREDKNKRTELTARTVHQTGSTADGDRARTAVPVVSYRIFTRGRELTLLDRDVLHSPLTLNGIPLRGVHYLDDRWRLHAGYTAYATYQTFIVPLDRELVAGAAYQFRMGKNSFFTPGVFAVTGEGAIVSMLLDHKPSDAAALRMELGVSDGVGAALQFSYDTRRHRARADIRYRPEGFAVIGPSDAQGLLGDASWSHEYGRGSYVGASVAASDLDFLDQRVLAASVDVDHRLSHRLAVNAGVAWGSFNGKENFTVPVGARLDFARGGVGALYRYSQSASDRGGHGGRLFGRVSHGRLYASAYIDRQQNAPTLEVIFGEHPELALALSELGIAATSPADIARALREHAALAELGYVEGITVDLAPMRTQAGFEVAFLGNSPARHQLRARLMHNVIESVASRTATTIANLSYSRRITSGTDVFAGYTYWRSERRGQEANVQPYLEVGVRQRFDGLPTLGVGGGTISGVVFADEDLDGKSDGSGVVAEVELDGTRREATAPDGTFTFRNVPRGSHRVVARVAQPDAYFTTPSRVEIETGERVAFGVAKTPARIFGRVVTDAGEGLAGVRVLLARGPKQIFATTDSEGAFNAATPPGEWEISILSDSVPAGHALTGTEAKSVTLERSQPKEVAWQLRALRSVSGRGAPANAELEILPLGKRVKTDAEGRFSVRSLPPGELTIVAGKTRRSVVVPKGPASLTVDLTDVAPPVAVASSASTPVAKTAAKAVEAPVRTIVSGERRDTMKWIVNIGAFRVRANAVETMTKARRTGVDARLATKGPLTVVHAGPFDTRHEADATEAALERAGLDAVVASTN